MQAFIAPTLFRFRHNHPIQSSAPPSVRATPRDRRNVLATVDLSAPKSNPFPALSTLLTRAPRPVVIARQQLNQDFAVLLMRCGYAAVDELDFVPMQQFQAVFFDIRSREWEQFIRRNFGIRQGVIGDPRYFDFISYAQMLTIQHFMREPQVVFEEAYGDADGSFKTRVVKRDVERFPSSVSLLGGWRRQVGKAIYERMVETVNRPVAETGDDGASIVRGIKDIYDYFLLAGFCLDVRLMEVVGNRVCRVEMIAPCILWGCEALRRLKSIPNDYDCLCVEEYCERCGVEMKCWTQFTENSIVRNFNFSVWSGPL